ncbi:hypothetical protein [Acinetobacter sp. YH12069]|uniref:hypothetical protein n=1 Tax=Acinetobacter sp. YH12069 TaxID=2601065 RepID=UPI0015D12A18|nr:hypothetical protein [Acinetobacter sp. YH12069]
MKNIVITSCLLMSMHCFANAPVPQNHATNAPSVKNIQDFKKIKGMTNDASRYYKFINIYGWSAIVQEFENKNIQSSKMKNKEIKKMCDTAHLILPLQDIKRLIAANCKPSSNDVTFNTINRTLKNGDGSINEQEIIAKLEFYNALGLLKTHQTYGRGYRAETYNLLYKAAGFGLPNVFDYLLNIRLTVKYTDGNLLNTHFDGRSPQLALTQKILKLGVEPNASTITIMQQRNFKQHYPDIYQVILSNLEQKNRKL